MEECRCGRRPHVLFFLIFCGFFFFFFSRSRRWFYNHGNLFTRLVKLSVFASVPRPRSIILGTFHGNIPRTEQSTKILGLGINDNGMMILIVFENLGRFIPAHVFRASRKKFFLRHDFFDGTIQLQTCIVRLDEICFSYNTHWNRIGTQRKNDHGSDFVFEHEIHDMTDRIRRSGRNDLVGWFHKSSYSHDCNGLIDGLLIA
mmetsp:Transcript_67130/g.185623  ORF Transcript_67130/g.185623 Transcript_67130/m.185623 type:complete len:202 (+) Transcript_67130:283-888(+)